MGEGSNGFGNSPTPFLSKCYDVVNDPATDAIISWSATGDTFVVWDPPSFSRDLLPKYFKHSNFSSFVRQLNTYGFGKVDPDRWEFANDGFQKGQRHLLQTISRKKSAQNHHVQQSQSQQKYPYTNPCVEVGNFGLEKEVEMLKRDKNVLMQELVKVRQHQQNVDNQLGVVIEQLRQMEQNQQQMLSFFAMAMQKPGFLAQLLQQNGAKRHIVEVTKKRRMPTIETDTDNHDANSSGAIVKYKPLTDDSHKPLLLPDPNPATPPQSGPSLDGISDMSTNLDLKSLGIDLPIPLGEELLLSESDEMITVADIPNNFWEQLLLDVSMSENNEESGSDSPEHFGSAMQIESTKYNANLFETYRPLDLTEQTGLVASEMKGNFYTP
ncbi:heat stress transcription factor A-1a-like isoform X1 [Aristolochia californica]|uniref:heat stress transcription factor A-1a-like isoform X1 n=1 Tax=Aristolochia californica TaxID=171875 RepID=UPI0035D981A0